MAKLTHAPTKRPASRPLRRSLLRFGLSRRQSRRDSPTAPQPDKSACPALHLAENVYICTSEYDYSYPYSYYLLGEHSLLHRNLER